MGYVKRAIFHISHQMFNRNYLSLSKYVMKNEFKSSNDLLKEQDIKISKIIKYCYDNIPYYRKRWKELDINPNSIRTREQLKKIPVISKDDIRNNLNDFYPKNSSVSFNSQSTGGTTGTPLRYRVDKKNRMLGGVLLYRGWGYAGYQPGDKMVFLAGASLDINSNARTRAIHRITRNIVKLSSFDMNEEMVRSYIDVIKKEKPRFVRGYPSALSFISNYIDSNNIELPEIKGVFTTSEQLYPRMRDNIEKAFSTEVFDGYGLNDGCLSTFECKEHNGLHIDTERGYLEVIDEKTGNNIEGRSGKILATSLENYSMPLIRYDTGDTGILDSSFECGCGRKFPILKELLGRSVDIFVTPDNNIVHGWFFLFLFWENGDHILKYKVLQETKTKIKINIVPGEGFKDDEVDVILKIIKDKCTDWDVDVEIVDSIPTTGSGKFKFIESKVMVN